MAQVSEDTPIAIAVVCGVLIQKDGKCLLIQEKKPEAYGKWSLPAGRVQTGETLEQAAKREAKEESGLDVELDRQILVLHEAAEEPVFHIFSTSSVGGELAFPQSEILDAKWFTYEEIVTMKDELRKPSFILGALGAVEQTTP